MFGGPMMAGNLTQMYRYTGIGRPIDLRFPSNRYVMLVTAAAGAIAFALADAEPLAVAIQVAGSAFLGWAAGREIDPDRTLSAGLAAPAAAAVALIGSSEGFPVSLGALWLLVLSARITVRTTGRPPSRIDLALHLPIAAWVATSPYGWPAVLVLAVAVIRDTRVPERAPGENLWWGAAIGIVGSGVAGVAGGTAPWETPTPTSAALLVAGIVGTAVLVRPQPVSSTADMDGRPLDPARLSMGRMLLGVGAAVTSMIGGAGAIGAVGPMWAVLAVVAMVRLSRR